MGDVGTFRAQARAVLQAQAALAPLARANRANWQECRCCWKSIPMRQEMLERVEPGAVRHDMHCLLQAETGVPPKAGSLHTALGASGL